MNWLCIQKQNKSSLLIKWNKTTDFIEKKMFSIENKLHKHKREKNIVQQKKKKKTLIVSVVLSSVPGRILDHEQQSNEFCYQNWKYYLYFYSLV